MVYIKFAFFDVRESNVLENLESHFFGGEREPIVDHSVHLYGWSVASLCKVDVSHVNSHLNASSEVFVLHDLCVLCEGFFEDTA